MKKNLTSFFVLALLAPVPGLFFAPESFGGNCDRANIEIAKAILKDPSNENIFKNMHDLALLKWKYMVLHFAGGNQTIFLDQVKEAAKGLTPKQTPDFEGQLVGAYRKYGINEDVQFLNELSKPRDYAQTRILDHRLAGALTLYYVHKKEKQNQAKIPAEVQFKESDAAALWAYRVLDPAPEESSLFLFGPQSADKTIIQERIQDKQHWIDTAIALNASSIRDQYPNCFGVKCANRVTPKQIEEIHDAILTLVPKVKRGEVPDLKGFRWEITKRGEPVLRSQ